MNMLENTKYFSPSLQEASLGGEDAFLSERKSLSKCLPFLFPPQPPVVYFAGSERLVFGKGIEFWFAYVFFFCLLGIFNCLEISSSWSENSLFERIVSISSQILFRKLMLRAVEEMQGEGEKLTRDTVGGNNNRSIEYWRGTFFRLHV